MSRHHPCVVALQLHKEDQSVDTHTCLALYEVYVKFSTAGLARVHPRTSALAKHILTCHYWFPSTQLSGSVEFGKH